MSNSVPDRIRPRRELSLANSGPSAPGTQELDESVDLRRWVEGTIKRWWVVLIATVIGVGASTGWVLQLPKLYRTSATVLVEQNTPNVLSGVEQVVPVGTGGWWGGQDFYEREYLVIKSRQVAGYAAEILGAEFFGRELPEDTSTLLTGRYSVIPDRKAAGVVRIQVIDQEPTRAQKIANAVARSYEEQNLEGRIKGTRDAGTWLSLQYRDLKKKLESSEDDLYKFLEENDVLNASLETQLHEVTQRLDAFNTQLATVQAERIRTKVDAAALAAAKDQPDLIETLEAVQSANLVSSLKTRLTDLAATRSELGGRYQASHPKMLALDEQINSIKRELQGEINALVVALERQQQSLSESERGLRSAIGREREREARLNRLAIEFNRLQREVRTNEKLFDMVTGRMKEADLSGAMRFNNVRILDEARVPGSHFEPSVKRYLMMGFLIGLFLGIGIALLLEFFDNTIKSHLDIEQGLDLPFIGVVPIISAVEGPARDTFVMDNPKSQAAESMRFIRTNLMFMGTERPLNTLMVTSAMPKDGKTTTAVSLAITMAQAGSRTLIVDADMRRPRVHRVFGYENDRGVSSVLVGEHKLDDVIRKTDEPNLDVLVCGPAPPNPAELLHTKRFSDLIPELTSRYDRVIFDSPPSVAVADPLILGSLIDGTILVVRGAQTSRVAAKQAVRGLRDANVPILGAILNTVDVQGRRYYSGSYYYAKYPTYGEDAA